MTRWSAPLAALLVGVSSVRAERPGAAFLTLDPSVRSQALGGSQALLTGAEAMGHNPAGLALLPVAGEAIANYGPLDEGVSYGHAAVARRWPGRGPVAGLSVTGLFADGGNGTDALGQPVGGSTDAGDFSFAAGLGGGLVPNVFWGLAGRGVRSTLAGVSSDWAWAGDVGLLYRLPRASLGVSAQNLGTELKFERDGDPLPSSVRCDAAWTTGAWALVGQARFDLPEKKNRWTAGGGIPDGAPGPAGRIFVGGERWREDGRGAGGIVVPGKNFFRDGVSVQGGAAGLRPGGSGGRRQGLAPVGPGLARGRRGKSLDVPGPRRSVGGTPPTGAQEGPVY
ncbi:MAG: hypothetical protein IPJ35_03485 [Elusimicrobia bacterium]|nr:hypothetical protein [Elusimicrobiota bacterium]